MEIYKKEKQSNADDKKCLKGTDDIFNTFTPYLMCRKKDNVIYEPINNRLICFFKFLSFYSKK